MPITFYLWNIFSSINLSVFLYAVCFSFKRKYSLIATVIPPLLFNGTIFTIMIINNGRPKF